MPANPETYTSQTCRYNCAQGCAFFQSANGLPDSEARRIANALDECEIHAEVAVALELLSEGFDEPDSDSPPVDSDN